MAEVGLKDEGHTFWKKAKLDYMKVDLFPFPLVREDIEVVVLG